MQRQRGANNLQVHLVAHRIECNRRQKIQDFHKFHEDEATHSDDLDDVNRTNFYLRQEIRHPQKVSHCPDILDEADKNLGHFLGLVDLSPIRRPRIIRI